MKNLIYILILIIFSFSCSKSDDNCTWYLATLGYDSCYCAITDNNCKITLHVTRTEYLRLMKLRDESTEKCFLVKSYSRYTGDAFEGYLIDLSTMDCPEIDFI